MHATAPLSLVQPNANDRLKQAFDTSLWRALTIAALLHFLVLAFWPSMQPPDYSMSSEEMISLDLLPEVEIPPPPEEISRPAVPVLSADITIDEDISIGPNTFDANPPTELPPPPLGQANVGGAPAFVPREVEPVLRNRAEFIRALERAYPPTLRDAGIGGTVLLWVRVGDTGNVLDTKVITSAGHEQLDGLAQQLVREVARFSPALNRDQPVTVWIQLPVTFQTR
jgi:TonB family protein